ncbi:unnamed protein product [Bathycoccus prasinos]
MEMNNAALKDGNLRTLVARSEQQRILYKAILQDRSLPQPLRIKKKLGGPNKKSLCSEWAWQGCSSVIQMFTNCFKGTRFKW